MKTKGNRPAEGREKVTLELTAGSKEKLIFLAAQNGFIVDRGSYAGKGSVSAFIDAIAKGELVCIRSASDLEG